jgi:hypothetical protein
MIDAATIRIAHRDECRARTRFWICGVPNATDIQAVSKTIAARLKISLAEVDAALAEDGPLGAAP